MNFLFPLYLLGLAALSVPIFLHLRNRELKKTVPFSSLRFLQPTPIVQEQRAKIENLLLLLLRCLILALLAMVFTRPFLRQDLLKDIQGKSKQVVFLLDTSASMQREEVWDKAVDRMDELIDNLKSTDEVQVFIFDQSARLLHSFDAWREAAETERKAELKAKLAAVEPSWQSTNLGQALITAVESFRDALEDVDAEIPAERTVYLVSDFQEGANLESLGQYNWPLEISLVQERVGNRLTNASLQLLPKAAGIAELQNQEDRLRLTNDRDSEDTRFTLSWQNADGTPASRPISVQVPAGETQVITAPKTTTGNPAPVLILDGDEEDFDNRYFQSPPVAKPMRILYHGDEDPDRPGAPLFFFKRALIQTPTFKPELTLKRSTDSIEQIDWSLLDYLVMSEPAGNTDMTPYRTFLEEGGRGLFIARSVNSIAALSNLLDVDAIPAQEASVVDFSLLAKINRQHPYLQGFAEARFADFSKIHFWHHRKLDVSGLENAMVLSTFDNGDPAWIEVPIGKGSLLVFTSSWHQADSQLALSTKFIPLIYAILTQDRNAQSSKRTYVVGDAIPIDPGKEKTVILPDGKTLTLEENAVVFDQTLQPGLFTIEDGVKTLSVAVNLSSEESRLFPLDTDKVQQLLKLDREVSEDGEAQDKIPPAKLSIEEQESRQKIWLWLLYAVLILVLIEILYSARCATPKTPAEGI
jgi:hypothetical protein